MHNVSKKIPVAVLGATGTVGQRFIQLLEDHPWFEVVVLAGSERTQGQRYGDVVQWKLSGSIPVGVSDLILQPVTTKMPVKLAFSALPSSVAYEAEPKLAQAGIVVCSNASAYRTAVDVPLIIPEINADHLQLISTQWRNRGGEGFIVTSPNCTTTGIALTLKPLEDAFGVEKVFAVSLQAISGAGYPGVSALDISGNVVPHISGEEEKIEEETRILLGNVVDGVKNAHPLTMSAQANRVPVIDGHMICLSVQLKTKATPEEACAAIENYQMDADIANLPSAPRNLFVVHRHPGRPQPRIDKGAEGGMAVSVGQIRPCPLLDLKLTTVVHNTIRGAAGGAILNAELLVTRGYLE